MNFEIMVATDKPIYYVFSRGRLIGTYMHILLAQQY